MSTPSEPTGADRPDANEPEVVNPAPDAAPAPEVPASEAPASEAPESTGAQPTAAYPADAQPTEAYPPAPPAPPAYGQAPQQAYGQPGYGQAPQQPYGQPAYAAAPAGPTGPDTRPKTLAIVSLGLAVLGVVLACIGFVPVPWVGFISVLIGGLVLLVAFVLSIVALASRKQGGKPFSIAGLVVSVLGGGLWAVALFVSIALTAITSSSSTGTVPAPSETASVAPGETEGETEGETPGGAYDQTAFLAEVRPVLLETLQDVDSSVTEELVNQMFPDEALVSLGQSVLLLGDAGRDTVIESFTSTGVLDDEAAGRLVDALYSAAEKHLQE